MNCLGHIISFSNEIELRVYFRLESNPLVTSSQTKPASGGAIGCYIVWARVFNTAYVLKEYCLKGRPLGISHIAPSAGAKNNDTSVGFVFREIFSLPRGSPTIISMDDF